MKKHLIAAAVAGAFAVPAMAQVTVSGVLDVTAYGTQKNETSTTANTKTSSTAMAVNSNGAWTTSVINFRADEDLGGGLKATAFVNQSVNGNSGAFGGRDRWIALEGSFGKIQVGRFTPAIDGYGGFAAPGTTNSAGTTDSSGHDLIDGTIGGGTAAGILSRQAGVVQYATPVMSGLRLTAEVVRNSSDNNASDRLGKNETDILAVRVDYSAGPLTVALASGTVTTKGEAAPAVAPVTATATTNGVLGTAAVNRSEREGEAMWIGARYNLGFATLSFAHGTREDTNKLTPGVLKDVSVNNVGVSIPLGAATLTASMYEGEDKSSAAASARDLEGYQLTARYALSKRTSAYLVIGQNENIGKAAGSSALKISETALGLVHSF